MLLNKLRKDAEIKKGSAFPTTESPWCSFGREGLKRRKTRLTEMPIAAGRVKNSPSTIKGKGLKRSSIR
jgi:hypothetical protein